MPNQETHKLGFIKGNKKQTILFFAKVALTPIETIDPKELYFYCWHLKKQSVGAKIDIHI